MFFVIHNSFKENRTEKRSNGKQPFDCSLVFGLFEVSLCHNHREKNLIQVSIRAATVCARTTHVFHPCAIFVLKINVSSFPFLHCPCSLAILKIRKIRGYASRSKHFNIRFLSVSYLDCLFIRRHGALCWWRRPGENRNSECSCTCNAAR